MYILGDLVYIFTHRCYFYSYLIGRGEYSISQYDQRFLLAAKYEPMGPSDEISHVRTRYMCNMES